jgi:hypothetical protein
MQSAGNMAFGATVYADRRAFVVASTGQRIPGELVGPPIVV